MVEGIASRTGEDIFTAVTTIIAGIFSNGDVSNPETSALVRMSMKVGVLERLTPSTI